MRYNGFHKSGRRRYKLKPSCAQLPLEMWVVISASVTSYAETLGTPPDPASPSSILCDIVFMTPCVDDHPPSLERMDHTRCPRGRQILADVCNVLTDGHGSFLEIL